MAINSYSKARDGAKQITAHFKVREFACKDGSDKILVDEVLARKLEALRLICGSAITISSGYRTPAHNRKIGGATNSQHIQGKAADIITAGHTPMQMAKLAQALGLGGIEVNLDTNYLHIDTRANHYYWIRKGGRDVTQGGFGGACPYKTPTVTVKRGQKGDNVKWLQWWLNLWGAALTVDGSFGDATEKALKKYQTERGLTADGLCGKNTRAALRGD